MEGRELEMDGQGPLLETRSQGIVEPGGMKGRARARARSPTRRQRAAMRSASSSWMRRLRMARDSRRKFIAPQSTTRLDRRFSKWMMIGMEIPSAPRRRMVLRKSMPEAGSGSKK